MALSRVRWVTLAIALLAVGVGVTFVLELRYISRSRPAPELDASIVWRTEGFNTTLGISAHPAGDIYVADLGARLVHRVSPSGTLLGAWPAEGPGALLEPSDVSAGELGAVYVIDAVGRIVRLEPDGGLTAVLDLAPFGPFMPRGLAVDDARGVFYVADTGGGRVLVVRPAGVVSDAWGEAGDEIPRFQEPRGLGVDQSGNVYVAEAASSRVSKISPDGELLASWTVKGPVADLAVGRDDLVYVSAADRARLWVFDLDGKAVGQVEDPFEEAGLSRIGGVAVLGAGDVVVGVGTAVVRLSIAVGD